jgi:hypothetical protein
VIGAWNTDAVFLITCPNGTKTTCSAYQHCPFWWLRYHLQVVGDWSRLTYRHGHPSCRQGGIQFLWEVISWFFQARNESANRGPEEVEVFNCFTAITAVSRRHSSTLLTRQLCTSHYLDEQGEQAALFEVSYRAISTKSFSSRGVSLHSTGPSDDASQHSLSHALVKTA